jgi:hypothetical protein
MKTLKTKLCGHALFVPERPRPSAKCVKRPARRSPWTVVALLTLSLNYALGASEQAAPPQTPAETLVGETGRLGLIQFEGNQTFNREQLLTALKFDFEVQLAAHPREPLSNYLAALEKKVRAGYRREGFPEASVQAVLGTNTGAILLRVVEGPRFHCGQLRIHGLETNAVVLQTLQSALVNPRREESDPVFWQKEAAAPFDPEALEVLQQRFQGALADAGYFEPRFQLKVVPAPATGLADLSLGLQSAGTTAVLDQIEVKGIFRNTPQQVLDFLGLKPGMPIKPGVANNVFEKLQDSGRFFHHEVDLSQSTLAAGHFKLELKLDETEFAPTLDRPLSPVEQALLQFGERVRHWDTQTEDLVCVLDLPMQHSTVRAELVLSSAGIAGVLRAGVSNAPARLQAGGVLAGRRIALYAPGQHLKLLLEPARGFVPIELQVPVPRIPFAGPVQYFGFSVKPYFTQPAPQLLQVGFDIRPVNFLCAAHYFESSVQQNEITLAERDAAGTTSFQLRLDLATGKLLSADYPLARGSVHLKAEEGAFARVVNEITAAGVTCTNRLDSSQGLLALLPREASAAVLEPAVLQDLNELLASPGTNNAWGQLRPFLASTGRELGRLRVLLEADDSGKLLQPWKSFWHAITWRGTDTFDIPPARLPDRTPTQQAFAPLAAAVFAEADRVFALGSWAWTALRESAFVLEGATDHAQQSFQQIRTSEEVGPFGCAILAALLVEVPEGRQFARLGTNRLTLADFHRDYQVLLQTNTVIGDVLRNAAGLFQKLTPEQAATLVPEGDSAKSLFVRDLSQALRSGREPVAKAAWPVLERHWDKVVRPTLEAALNETLPKVQSLTNNAALLARAHELMRDGLSTEQAKEEMLACLHKAAAQGDAEAQYHLGDYYLRQKDLSQAVLWLEKSGRQDFQHTGCRLGDIYSEPGLLQDPVRAAEWYQREAEHGCGYAQYCFGRHLMNQKKTAEGLSWYRRAAENGSAQAMVALGEFYSDDLFNTPDYVQAYVYLRLVTCQEGLPSAVTLPAQASLRRVRSKLSPAQVEEVCKRGTAFARIFEANAGARKASQKQNQPDQI